MKRILFAFNLLFLAVIIVMATSMKRPIADPCHTIVMDYSGQPWTGRILASFAKEMADNYRADAGKKYIWTSKGATTKEDAYSINFKLSVLKRFIWQIESSACAQHCNDTIGIRFYYAKYPDDPKRIWGPLSAQTKPNYTNRHTLFAVATYQDPVTKRYIDYNPNAGCRGKFDFSAGAKPALIFLLAPGSTSIEEGQNHGGLMPPPAGTGTFPNQ